MWQKTTRAMSDLMFRPRHFGGALLLVFTGLAGCGGGDGGGPVAVDEDPPVVLQVSDGVFDVTSNIIFNSCNSSASYDGAYDVQIDSLSFSMGDEWTGSWDPVAARASAESDHERATYRSCTVTTWTSVNVTFESVDEFSGSISFRRRIDGDCDTPCLTTWGIAGVRRQPTP